jgi:hypothetical protein
MIIPFLAIFSRLNLDFRESKCFLRGPETLVEMKFKKSVNLVNNWITIVPFNSVLSRTIIRVFLYNLCPWHRKL